jgi:hypothetical protein
MRRRAPDEHVAEFRERDAALSAAPLRDRIEAWATAELDALAKARPEMPQGVRDRPAEVWEALLAVADVAGGNWPERARDACRYFVLDTEHDERLSLGLRLLRDIKKAFADSDRMFSADLVTALTSDPESEWRDLWGKPLDQRRLARELKRYSIESQEVRIGAQNRKGYVIDGETGLAQAWHRYLPSISMRDKRDKGDIAGQSVADVSRIDAERDKRDTSATPENACEHPLFDSVADVADVADIDGMSHNGHAEHCQQCANPIPEHMRSARARGVCTSCAGKASANAAVRR